MAIRVTLDLPALLFRELEAKAATQGIKMNELITRLIEAGLRQTSGGSPERPRQRSPLPVIDAANTGEPIPALSPNELAQLEVDEDLEKLDRSFRR